MTLFQSAPVCEDGGNLARTAARLGLWMFQSAPVCEDGGNFGRQLALWLADVSIRPRL